MMSIMHCHELSLKSDYPILYDPTGKRFGRIIMAAVATLLLIMGTLTWITIEQFKPIWHATQNTNAEYPQQLIATNGGSLPVIGERQAR
jgi:biofilm PGA synthesis N-glycosyltransferase PgaC